MNKGQWTRMGFGHNSIYCEREFLGTIFEIEDADKVLSAVNNTYVKGINPEGIEKMKSILETLSAMASIGEAISSHEHKLIDEALTAVRLKP